MSRRQRIWKQLAGPWKLDILDKLSVCITLDQLSPVIDEMLEAKVRGRIVIDLRKGT